MNLVIRVALVSVNKDRSNRWFGLALQCYPEPYGSRFPTFVGLFLWLGVFLFCMCGLILLAEVIFSYFLLLQYFLVEDNFFYHNLLFTF